jgi:hypothetical protein
MSYTTPFSSSDDECSGKRLEIGASCTVEIYYGGGTSPQTVTFTDSISGTSRSLQLTGGEASQTLNYPTATPSVLQFGGLAVGDTSAVQNASVAQADGHPMVVSIDGPGDFLIDSGTCAQGTPCQIGARFHPLSAGANKGATVTIRDRITGASTVVRLGGTGGLPQISASPSSIVFPTQTIGSTWAYQSVAIENTGDALLTLSATLLGANSDDFVISPNVGCGGQVSPGGNCGMLIGFVPQALGERTATLQITSDSQTDKVINIPVSATSTPVP